MRRLAKATWRAATASILLILWACNGAGCAGWQAKAKTTFAEAHKAAKGMSAGGEPLFNAKCTLEARGCRAKGDTTCEPLKKCEEGFKAFNKVVLSIHMMCASGLTAVELEYKKRALDLVVQVGYALARLYHLAEKAGITSWSK